MKRINCELITIENHCKRRSSTIILYDSNTFCYTRTKNYSFAIRFIVLILIIRLSVSVRRDLKELSSTNRCICVSENLQVCKYMEVIRDKYQGFFGSCSKNMKCALHYVILCRNKSKLNIILLIKRKLCYCHLQKCSNTSVFIIYGCLCFILAQVCKVQNMASLIWSYCYRKPSVPKISLNIFPDFIRH